METSGRRSNHFIDVDFQVRTVEMTEQTLFSLLLEQLSSSDSKFSIILPDPDSQIDDIDLYAIDVDGLVEALKGGGNIELTDYLPQKSDVSSELYSNFQPNLSEMSISSQHETITQYPVFHTNDNENTWIESSLLEMFCLHSSQIESILKRLIVTLKIQMDPLSTLSEIIPPVSQHFRETASFGSHLRDIYSKPSFYPTVHQLNLIVNDLVLLINGLPDLSPTEASFSQMMWEDLLCLSPSLAKGGQQCVLDTLGQTVRNKTHTENSTLLAYLGGCDPFYSSQALLVCNSANPIKAQLDSGDNPQFSLFQVSTHFFALLLEKSRHPPGSFGPFASPQEHTEWKTAHAQFVEWCSRLSLGLFQHKLPPITDEAPSSIPTFSLPEISPQCVLSAERDAPNTLYRADPSVQPSLSLDTASQVVSSFTKQLCSFSSASPARNATNDAYGETLRSLEQIITSLANTNQPFTKKPEQSPSLLQQNHSTQSLASVSSEDDEGGGHPHPGHTPEQINPFFGASGIALLSSSKTATPKMGAGKKSSRPKHDNVQSPSVSSLHSQQSTPLETDLTNVILQPTLPHRSALFLTHSIPFTASVPLLFVMLLPVFKKPLLISEVVVPDEKKEEAKPKFTNQIDFETALLFQSDVTKTEDDADVSLMTDELVDDLYALRDNYTTLVSVVRKVAQTVFGLPSITVDILLLFQVSLRVTSLLILHKHFPTQDSIHRLVSEDNHLFAISFASSTRILDTAGKLQKSSFTGYTTSANSPLLDPTHSLISTMSFLTPVVRASANIFSTIATDFHNLSTGGIFQYVFRAFLNTQAASTVLNEIFDGSKKG
ncbi:hypothetical protein BLNAU_13588 [Blattamonas nauphoetae]|uniref:Uncharacterized protein n=1 Tax=Blattamonas nauphoetae TaxID=2049346 RepID=A0ABQ9XME7_9EUKA|nr:hypothetical protein BLNAU_13588 [Blattamonas nauphoetae]